MGKNNSGRRRRRLEMTHFAGYVPRFHPSDFQTKTRDGVGADWPISYRDLPRDFERLERSCPSRARTGPGATRTRTRTRPPDRGRGLGRLAGRTALRDRDARRAGLDHERRLRQPAALHLPRLLPPGLQGEREGGPLITHVPDAIEHGVEVRADSMATRIEVDDATGRCTGVTYVARREGALPAGRGGRGLRLRDREPAAAAQLGLQRFPTGSRTATTTSAAT